MATMPLENLEAAFQDKIITMKLTKRQRLYYHPSVVLASDMLNVILAAGPTGLDYDQIRTRLKVSMETAKQYAAWLKSHQLITIDREHTDVSRWPISIVRITQEQSTGKQRGSSA